MRAWSAERIAQRKEKGVERIVDSAEGNPYSGLRGRNTTMPGLAAA